MFVIVLYCKQRENVHNWNRRIHLTDLPVFQKDSYLLGHPEFKMNVFLDNPVLDEDPDLIFSTSPCVCCIWKLHFNLLVTLYLIKDSYFLGPPVFDMGTLLNIYFDCRHVTPSCRYNSIESSSSEFSWKWKNLARFLFMPRFYPNPWRYWRGIQDIQGPGDMCQDRIFRGNIE